MAGKKECFISVDVETSGPIPGDYSMLSLGACVVGGKDDGFYVEIKPLNDNAVPDALKVSGFDLAKLAKTGERPEDAMAKLRDWVKKVSGVAKPVFVGLQRGLRLVLRQLVLHPLSGREPVRLRAAGRQVLLHGPDRLRVGRHEVEPHPAGVPARQAGRPQRARRRPRAGRDVREDAGGCRDECGSNGGARGPTECAPWTGVGLQREV